MPTDNFTVILQFASQNEGKITTAQANELLADRYYCNGAHYVSESLTRMVRNGTLNRVSRGHYEINPGFKKRRTQIESEQQQKLL
jgi:predicted transcriptional regulator of viral defense system